jgi:hypothetical protein
MTGVPLLLVDGHNLLFRACFGTPAQILSRDATGKRRVRGDARPLDTFTAEAIAGYLRYRHRQWPRTANPHLLVTRLTCNGLSPADPGTVKRWLKGVATPPGCASPAFSTRRSPPAATRSSSRPCSASPPRPAPATPTPPGTAPLTPDHHSPTAATTSAARGSGGARQPGQLVRHDNAVRASTPDHA